MHHLITRHLESSALIFFLSNHCRYTYQTTMRANLLLTTKSSVIPTKPTFRPHQVLLEQEDSSNKPLEPIINDESANEIQSPLYKPTFKPSVIIHEISNVEVTIPTTQPPTSSVTDTSLVDEKNDITSFVNDLSSNSLVNLLVVFGLPAVTALLSFMGAGPLAIASVAWLIPIAAVTILPDLRRNVE